MFENLNCPYITLHKTHFYHEEYKGGKEERRPRNRLVLNKNQRTT